MGEYFKKLRIIKGYSQKEVAQMVGVYPSSVINWEKNRYLPCRKYIRKLAKVLDPDPFELVQFEGVLSKLHKQILEFFEENPMSTQKECKEALGISWDLHKELLYLLDIGILEREFKGKTAHYRVRGKLERMISS